jgi:hypothetical protein
MRIRERIPRDENGVPIYSAPHRENADYGGMLNAEDTGPDSSEVVDFDRDESPSYLLGRLESLQEVYKDSMPGGCRSHLRKGIGILQRLVSPKSESARHDYRDGVLQQLREAYSAESTAFSNYHDDDFPWPAPPMATVMESSPLTPGPRSDHDLANFASQLR